MPSSFFAFQQGSDTRSIPPPDSESLRYGRFRAFSSKRSVGDLFSVFSSTQGSSHPSPIYGSINFATAAEAVENEDSDPDQRWWLNRMLISPRRETVLKVVKHWSTRLFVIVVMPAVIVSLLATPRATTTDVRRVSYGALFRSPLRRPTIWMPILAPSTLAMLWSGRRPRPGHTSWTPSRMSLTSPCCGT